MNLSVRSCELGRTGFERVLAAVGRCRIGPSRRLQMVSWSFVLSPCLVIGTIVRVYLHITSSGCPKRRLSARVALFARQRSQCYEYRFRKGSRRSHPIPRFLCIHRIRWKILIQVPQRLAKHSSCAYVFFASMVITGTSSCCEVFSVS